MKYSPSNGTEWSPTSLRAADDYRNVYPLGTWFYNPWTGTRRDDLDIASDPKGLLILPPDEEMAAASDWIEWQGTCACPALPDVLVDVQWRNGEQTLRRAAGRIGWGPGVKAYRLSKLGVLKSVAIGDTNTIVNAFAQGGAADQMAAQRRRTQFLTEEHADAVLDAAKVNIMGDLLVESRPAAVKTLMSLGYRYEGGEMWVPPIGKAPPFSAPDLLDAAAGHMRDRAATYDKPEGERSMGKTVQAFNTITGRDDQVITSVRSKLIGTLAVLKTEGQFVDHNVLIEMLQGIEVMLGSMPSRSLRESEGWLLMALLKMVRSETRETPHEDSVTDLIAYCALFGEARLGTK